MNIKLYLKALLVCSTGLISIGNNAFAKPAFANETGYNCQGCHIGKMTDKKFTWDGKQYCISLKQRGLLSSSGKSSSCANETLDLYDIRGKHVGKHTVCVPVPDPAPC